MARACKRDGVFLTALGIDQGHSGARNVCRFLLLLIAITSGCSQPNQPAEEASIHATVTNLASLLKMPASAYEQLDLAAINLHCAEGLPGAENLDVEKGLVALDAMAASVRTETDRHFYR